MKVKYRQCSLKTNSGRHQVAYLPDTFCHYGNYVWIPDKDGENNTRWQITGVSDHLEDRAIDTNKLIREHRKNTGDSTPK